MQNDSCQDDPEGFGDQEQFHSHKSIDYEKGIGNTGKHLWAGESGKNWFTHQLGG